MPLRCFFGAGVVALLLVVTPGAWAGTESPCTAAITAAEARAGIPPGLLAAMGTVESGRPGPDGQRQAWPWAMNSTGTGRLFDTAEQAIAATVRLRQGGQPSVDVGCLQINLLHHPTAFASVEEAFDPVRNAEYAASFLSSLRAASVSQDWMEAVGHYHSFRADLADAYRARVQAALNGLPVGSGTAGPGWLLSPRPAVHKTEALPPRPAGTVPDDWVHLVVARPRQSWRAPEPAAALSPDRAMALAGALDRLSSARPASRTAAAGR